MKFIVTKNGKNDGPHTIEEINAKLLAGGFGVSDLAWTEGWPTWQPLSTIPGFVAPSPTFANPPPVPPPVPTASPAFSLVSLKRDIDSLDVTPLWKERFHLIEQIGWDDGCLKNYWNFMTLTIAQRFKMGSILGFLFGPIYYFVKGMWQKGIFIFAIALVLANLRLPGAFNILIAAYCGSMASYDYYLWKVHGKQLY